VVRHAHATMFGHLSSKALKNFKIGLKQSLNDGKGFAESVRAIKRSCMSDFDRGCEGNILLLKVHTHTCI
jgi:hypothetical protein